VLATMFGHYAIDKLMHGAQGQVVVLSGGKLGAISIESVAGKQRRVPPDDPLVVAARAVGTDFGD
jgi:hypothetical protein